MPFTNLNPTDKEKVEQKLTELRSFTGQTWDYEILQQPRLHKYPYLEITVAGRIARPIALEKDDYPADRICGELERLFERRKFAA